MILGRHSLVVLVLIAAVLSLFFSPLVPTHGTSPRHHPRAGFPVIAGLTGASPSAASPVVAFAVPQARASHSELLLELHCARLC